MRVQKKCPTTVLRTLLIYLVVFLFYAKFGLDIISDIDHG